MSDTCAECGGTVNVRSFHTTTGRVFVDGAVAGRNVLLCAMHFPRMTEWARGRTHWQPHACKRVVFLHDPKYHRGD